VHPQAKPIKRESAAEQRWTSPRGEAAVILIRPSIVVIEMAGHVDEEQAQIFVPVAARHLAGSGQFRTFWDLERLVTYDTAVRTLSTKLLLDNRSKVAAVIVLSSSKVVRMGVAMANLALGGIIETSRTRVDFEMALRQARGAGSSDDR
jgi:hypothetical protein